tara:strand:- start:281 stop:1396 length:1116 start_codon:yes stop_codon:yes gene_type:complete
MTITRKISNTLSKPVILHYVLPVLMLYLTAGTVAQKYIGLFEATKMFFSSPILWVGFVPLPGLPLLIALIFLNLSFKLIFKSPWTLRNAGIILTHIGAMLLLIGGLFTALFSSEGYIDLSPTQQKMFVTDYHERAFAMLDEQGKEIQIFDHNDLSVGQTILIKNTPIKITILETCRNCKIENRTNANDQYSGMAQHMTLTNDALKTQDEDNMAGLTFRIKGSDHDGVFLVLENIPQLPEISIGDKSYQFALRKKQRKLPFSIELIEFKRDMHPGTTMAKSYQSRVRIHDGQAQWESLIKMNEPLRYKGYTFFQSSFIETPQGDISVLAVVWNAGRSFPYISGIAMCLGIIVHLFARRRTKRVKKREDAHVS